MSATENTTKSEARRNEQRRARKLASDEGITYQAALQRIREEVQESKEREAQAYSPPKQLDDLGALRKQGLVAYVETLFVGLGPAQKIVLEAAAKRLAQISREHPQLAAQFEEDTVNILAGRKHGSVPRDAVIVGILERLEALGASNIEVLVDGAGLQGTTVMEAAELLGSDSTPAKCIKKVYFYGDGAGEELLDYQEWAEYHIQERGVALDLAANMLNYGESRNDDEMEGVHEVYTIEDRPAFIAQLKAEIEELEADEFDMTLLEA